MPDPNQPLDPSFFAGAGAPPAPPPINPDPTMPAAPDLGTGVPQAQAQANLSVTPQQKAPAGPPQQSMVPALAGFLHQAFGGQNARGYEAAPPGQPGRPISRLDAFENFLGNFLSSFATGMSNAGTGPGASGRGFGAAVNAPYQRQVAQYQMGQQQQAQQSQIALQQAEAEQKQAQTAQMGQMITLPNGVTMPYGLAQKVYPAMVAGAAKVQAAGVQKQFLSTPFGIYDTKAQKYIEGGMKGAVTVTPEMQKEMNLPDEVVGQKMKVTELAAWMRGQASQITAVQGANGPALTRKVLPKGVNTQGLGLGSPAANTIAVQKQKLALQKYGDVLQALSPGAQKVLEETVPVHQQVNDLMSQFEAMKDDNTPGKFFKERALYFAGIHSDIGD